MNVAADVDQTLLKSRKIPIPRINFRYYRKSVYIVSNSALFSFASLYLINPKRIADIMHFKNITLSGSSVHWPLV